MFACVYASITPHWPSPLKGSPLDFGSAGKTFRLHLEQISCFPREQLLLPPPWPVSALLISTDLNQSLKRSWAVLIPAGKPQLLPWTGRGPVHPEEGRRGRSAGPELWGVTGACMRGLLAFSTHTGSEVIPLLVRDLRMKRYILMLPCLKQQTGIKEASLMMQAVFRKLYSLQAASFS